MARTATFSITNTAAGTSLTGICPFRPIELVDTIKSNVPPAQIANDPYTGISLLPAATQYFVNGDMVYLNAGAVTERLTAGVGAIAGFCVSGGSVDGGTTAVAVPTAAAPLIIMPVRTGDIYAMNTYISSAAATNMNDVKTYLGNIYNLVQVTVTEEDGSTTYCTVIDLTAATTTAQRVLVVGVQKNPEYTTSTPYIRLLVKFLPYVAVASLPTVPGLQFDA